MSAKAVVHVVGTGTIGEPLIGLFCRFKEESGIEEVTFHKRTPPLTDRPKVESLVSHGGMLVVDEVEAKDLQDLGMEPGCETIELLIEEIEERTSTSAGYEWISDRTFEQIVSKGTPSALYAAAAGMGGNAVLRDSSQTAASYFHSSHYSAENPPPNEYSRGGGSGFEQPPHAPHGVFIDKRLVLAMGLAAGAHILYVGEKTSFWQFLLLLCFAVISLNAHLDYDISMKRAKKIALDLLERIKNWIQRVPL